MCLGCEVSLTPLGEMAGCARFEAAGEAHHWRGGYGV